MAPTTFLMTLSMVAIASAGFPGWADNDNPFPGFPPPMFPVFPTIPTFTPMSVPDISKVVPPKGGSFQGVVVSMKSATKKKEDGTVVQEGGSTIMTNTNGVVSMQQTGNAPPEIPTNPPPFFDFEAAKIKPSKLNMFKNFDDSDRFNKFDDYNKFGFRKTFPVIEPIDPEKIKSYVPGSDETYKGYSVRSSSFSSNVNGDVKQGGSVVRIENDNGKVNEEKLVYGDGTKP